MFKRNGPPKLRDPFRPPRRSIDLKAMLRAAWDLVRWVKTCPECKGLGVIEYWRNENDHDGVDCWICDCRGKVSRSHGN